MPQPCPLCLSADNQPYFSDSKRSYRQCLRCQLVFVPAEFYLTAAEEKAEYDLHENSADDLGYRRFLSRAAKPVLNRVGANAIGLDFGSGPEPVLQSMLQEAGLKVSVYDIFYAPDESVFNTTYDFITATEVVEHLHEPVKVLEQLWQCLAAHGVLVVMTKRVIDVNAFSRWHYKNDPTHVCFFSDATFSWLAAKWQAELEYVDKDVVVFRKGDFG